MKFTKNDVRFMQVAINEAKKAIKKGQTPFGACLVKKGKLVSAAHNLVWKNTDITAHAEINALRAASQKLKNIDFTGLTMYSTCEPCPMCFSACHWAKISDIYYGAEIKHAKKLGFNELLISDTKMKRIGKSKIKIHKNLLLKENLALFDEWSGNVY